MSELNVYRDTMRKYCQEGLVRAEKLPSGHWRIDSTNIDEMLQNDRLIVEHLQVFMYEQEYNGYTETFQKRRLLVLRNQS